MPAKGIHFKPDQAEAYMLASGIKPSDIYEAMTMLYRHQRKVSGALKQPLIYFRLVDVRTACLRYVNPDDLADPWFFLTTQQKINHRKSNVNEDTLGSRTV